MAACAASWHAPAGLVGRWQPVSAMLGGRELPIASFGGAVLVLEAGSYQFGGDSGAVLLGGPGSPAQMDIQGKAGPNAGKTIPAIYALQQDELVICYQLGAGPRPHAFTSPAGTQVLLIRYRRA